APDPGRLVAERGAPRGVVHRDRLCVLLPPHRPHRRPAYRDSHVPDTAVRCGLGVAAARRGRHAEHGAGGRADSGRSRTESATRSEARGEILRNELGTAAPEAGRSLEFPELLNARDLGGYPTTDGAHTRRRSLVRADDLSQLSDFG